MLKFEKPKTTFENNPNNSAATMQVNHEISNLLIGLCSLKELTRLLESPIIKDTDDVFGVVTIRHDLSHIGMDEIKIFYSKDDGQLVYAECIKSEQ